MVVGQGQGQWGKVDPPVSLPTPAFLDKVHESIVVWEV